METKTLFERVVNTCLVETGIVVYRSRMQLAPELNNNSQYIATTNGFEIQVDPSLDDAEAAWVSLHLAGHCVQWACVPGSRENDLRTDRTWSEVQAYEIQAGGYGLWLCLHALGARSGVWYTERSAKDLRAYAKFLQVREVPVCVLTPIPPKTSGKMPARFIPGGAFDI